MMYADYVEGRSFTINDEANGEVRVFTDPAEIEGMFESILDTEDKAHETRLLTYWMYEKDELDQEREMDELHSQ